VDYEQLPLQYKACHEYQKFAKNCPKLKMDQPEEREKKQLKQLNRKKAVGKEGSQHQEKTQGGIPPSPSPHNPRYLNGGNELWKKHK
jgi:hypothetical protein